MCKSKFPEFEKGFRSHILEKNYENEKEINMKRKQEITKTEVSRSTAAIKSECINLHGGYSNSSPHNT